jgi:WD40 repeat protein
LRAIEASGNETRARAAQLLITSDYQRLEFSFRHPRMMGQGIRESFSGETPRIVAFSPDGKKIVTAGLDGTARLWSAETGAPIGEPMRNSDWVRAVAFSPDGRRLLTWSDDNTARLWCVETVSDADPIAGDHKQLMTEWQRRLGLKINEAGEIVPLWP